MKFSTNLVKTKFTKSAEILFTSGQYNMIPAALHYLPPAPIRNIVNPEMFFTLQF